MISLATAATRVERKKERGGGRWTIIGVKWI
jgi:hypothetical protein